MKGVDLVKKKLKDFLNRKVLAGALSVAMTFNMAAVLPASAFEGEDNEKTAEFGGHKYQLIDKSMSWNEAKEYCEKNGGYLATITSESEQKVIENLLLQGKKASYWLGATDKEKDGKWEWVTGENFSLYSNWALNQPDDYLNQEDCLMIYKDTKSEINNEKFGFWNDLNSDGTCNGESFFGTKTFGFICEWDNNSEKTEQVSEYTLFSGSDKGSFQLNCWKSNIDGNIYTGADFISNASEFSLNGKLDCAEKITANGWKTEIKEKNENVKRQEMPDWDARILKMAGEYETSDQDVVKIEDKNIISGSLVTTGKALISGTTFDGDCYIIADGDIIYNVNDFVSTGRVLLYSKNGNITVNGTNIDMNGIMYAPNGMVAFNSNIANINGRIFANKINFSGSIFNVKGSDSDWELLGKKDVISKTYTVDEDFNEGEFDGLSLDTADELTLGQRDQKENIPLNKEYKNNDEANGIEVKVNSNKSILNENSDTVDFEFDLNGYGSKEIEENNVDLAIVVDTSGSMDGSRKTNAKEAAKQVISKLKNNDRCCVVNFDYSAAVLQDFTNDSDLLNNAIDKLYASGGTNIAKGINTAIDLFNNLENNSRQKYIILLSDGQDSSNSSKAASNAFEQGIRIFTLSIGVDSNQMKTIAKNSNGIYLNSPTAEQIGEMMQQFAEEVFDNAGKDVSFEMTVSKNAEIDESEIQPALSEIIQNQNGTRTLKWNYDKISIDENQKITLPVSLSNLKPGLAEIADNISCTYFNRNGESEKIYADDIVMPVHSYKESGKWTAVYDSKNNDTVWKNINWNGKLYDDGKISVKACASNDENSFGDFTQVTNYTDIENLLGRYIKICVEMNVSLTGKTPELFDITVNSDSVEKTDCVNNAPESEIKGSDKTYVGKRLSLYSETTDDAFCSQLKFNWSCDDESVKISHSDKPYANFDFVKSGEYTIKLTVSDGNSEIVVTKTVKVYEDEKTMTPQISIDVPEIVKGGAEVNGKINNLNGAEISKCEVTVGNNSVSVNENGEFTFNVPKTDSIIGINAKAENSDGLFGTSDKSIIVDATAPNAELKADSDDIHVGDNVKISAFVSDENGIKNIKTTLNGEEIAFDESNNYNFVPQYSGEYEFTLTAYDIADNSNTATLKINVSELKHHNQPVVSYNIPKMLLVNESGDFTFKAEDETGIAEFSVKANGEEIILDENGHFTYYLNEAGDIVLNIHAKSNAGIDTDFELKVPVVSLNMTSDKSVYDENENVKITLDHSNNLKAAEQSATIDGKEYEIKNNEINAEGLAVGSHKVVWQIWDECGISFTGTLEISVQDTTLPEVSVQLADTDLKEGDSATAVITASDNIGIGSITAKLDGNEVAVNDGRSVLENLSAGKHSFEVTVTDTMGNYVVKTLEFSVLSNENKDTTPPELEVSAKITDDKKIEITAKADDDSGKVTVTGNINGEKIIFKDGKAVYTPENIGEYEVTVRAEDESGNYTEKTLTVTISEEKPEQELILSVKADKDVVKSNEKVNISVSTSEVLEKVEFSCKASGGQITENEKGYTFVSDKNGEFKVVVTAKTANGKTAEKTIYITVSDDEEESSEYVNTYTPEPRARVILDSKEQTETKMTEEMADLADHLKTPVAVYEYLYNNVNVEFYTGSRKGAIGAYEQNGGNDVDCASLLIAMLRYLGYDAEYVTGTIGVTEKQLLEQTGTDSVDNALNIIGIHFTPISKESKYYCYDHTWVRAIVDGEKYDLDICFKKYKRVLSLNDAAEFAEANYNIDEMIDLSDINAFKTAVSDSDFADPNSAFSFSGRAIVQKSIKKLPNSPAYINIKEKEVASDICDSKVILRDKATFSIGSESKEYYAPYLYVNDLTIGYTFNPNDLELMEMLGFPHPDSVYGLINAYYITGVRFDASPAIYINNKIDYTWNEATSVVQSNDLKITVFSSGITLDYEKTIDCGSINAFQFDFQNISPQEIMTSYANMPSEDVVGNIDTTKFRDSDCLKNYLTLMGAMYFSEFDIQNKIISSSLDVRQEKLLSFGVFTYNADIKAAKETDYGATFDETGSIEVDILDNTYIQKSYTGNKEDENSFHFLSGLASSYLESEIVEQFTGEMAVSTVSVLEAAMDMDVPINCINSQNINRLNDFKLYDEDKAIIRQAVSTGSYVIVPERNITINSWTGTGYIIQNDDTGELTFKISGALNGGATPNKATQDALKKYALICGSVAFVDTVSALYSSVMMMSNAVMSLMFASSTLGVVGSVAVIGASIALMDAAMKSYQLAIQNCFRVLEGDPNAAMELLIDTELTLIVNVLGELGGITSSAIKNKIAKSYIESTLPEELVPQIYKAFEGSEESVAKFMKSAKNAGIDTDCLIRLLRDSGCIEKYPKKVLKQLGKLEKEAQWAIIDGIEKCSKDLPDILKKLDKESLGEFFKAVSKNTDEVFEQLAKSANLERAIDFIAEYGENAADIFGKHSDIVIDIVKNAEDSEIAIKAIDCLGEAGINALSKVNTKKCAEAIISYRGAAGVIGKHGNDALKAITSSESLKTVDSTINAIEKYGEKAIKAFENATPTKVCSDLIIKYGDDATEVFAKFGDDAVDAVSNCDNKHKALKIIKEGGTQYGEQATQAIKKSGDKAAEALTKVPSKECAEIINKSSDKVIDAFNKLDVDDAKKFLEAIAGSKDIKNFFECIEESPDISKTINFIINYKDIGIDLIDKYGKVLYKNNLGEEEFLVLRRTNWVDIPESKIEPMKAVRESVAWPDKNTTMSKVFPASDFEGYMSGDYYQVGGFVTKAEDVANCKSYMDYFNTLGLDYSGTKFNKDTDECLYVIRFKSDAVEKSTGKLCIPYGEKFGGKETNPLPFTGNGFAGADVDTVTPEFKFDSFEDVMDGAEMYKVDRAGNQKLVAVYEKETENPSKNSKTGYGIFKKVDD